jgi:hypothetical protein
LSVSARTTARSFVLLQKSLCLFEAAAEPKVVAEHHDGFELGRSKGFDVFKRKHADIFHPTLPAGSYSKWRIVDSSHPKTPLLQVE